MSQVFHVHPQTPQPRLLSQAVALLRADALIVYPTDSCYALGCTLGNKSAMERARRIRGLDSTRHFTLVCRDLSELASYARVDNRAFRLLRSHTPGPYTFILQATRDVPRRLQDPKRRSVGLRVPDHPVSRALLDALGEPLMSVTLRLPGAAAPLSEPDEIVARVGNQVDLVLDAGACGVEPTSVIDLTGELPVVVRRGLGDVSAFAPAA